jgi:hypothetical protein
MVTVKNGERYETIILYKINGQKRLQNRVHGKFTFTFQKRKNHCTAFLYDLSAAPAPGLNAGSGTRPALIETK